MLLALTCRSLAINWQELFARPVDPELDGCPDYLAIIKHPMDLGTIRSRLQTQFYNVRTIRRSTCWVFTRLY